MKFAKPPRIQVFGFWLSMPLIVFALMYIMYGERVWEDWRIWAVTYPVIYFIGYFSWFMHYQYDHFLWKRFPALEQTTRRVLLKIAVNVLVMTPSVIIILLVFQAFRIFNYQIKEGDLKYAFLVGLTINLVFETLWEVIYIIEKYKEATAQKDLLEQLQLQEEFDGLKQKVNPHFLFNCFNTLSSLISEDKDRAEKFLDQLSKVYRYLLRNNEEGISTLGTELEFMECYFDLMKTRYGDSVFLRTEVDKKYYNYTLPTLSLQILVENAVKHNALSKSSPLYIEIFSTVGNKLVVSNNLQRRNVQAASNKIGLQNIRDKYKLLNVPGFQIMEDVKNFTVILPLIWNSRPGTKKQDLLEQFGINDA
jgi:sensor histidine kinase YesM